MDSFLSPNAAKPRRFLSVWALLLVYSGVIGAKKTQKLWICERQRAGKLVKEQRALRPRVSQHDDPNTRAEKNQVKTDPLRSSVRRRPVDRAELMLALMGERSTVYSLTFFDSFLPGRYDGVREKLNLFLRRMKRYLKRPFDYVYCIEGKHGDHRWHIHMVLRDEDFTEDEVAYLWGYGVDIEATPLILDIRDTYWRTAKYFVKEKTDGVRLPLYAKTCGYARGLYDKLPRLERWESHSGKIYIPKGAHVMVDRNIRNEFGAYHYVVYQRL